jgi:hypothetical protein
LNYIIEKSINTNPKKIEKSINTNENIEKSIIPENQRIWILNNEYVKNIYKLRDNSIINNKINLLRINSAYCKVCERIHDNENAYCNITENSIFFHCGRNTTRGVLIGHWYKNYNTYNKVKSNNNKYINKGTNTDDSYTTLENIINKMKEYINNLENKYNKLKEEFNLLNTNTNNANNTNNINGAINTSTKKYTKDINSEMWQKYYRLGKYIEEGLDDIVDNIRKSWRDGSWGRLKKRGLLIYEYINYINSNNIVNTISMRKIFHKKNYETFSSLL